MYKSKVRSVEGKFLSPRASSKHYQNMLQKIKSFVTSERMISLKIPVKLLGAQALVFFSAS